MQGGRIKGGEGGSSWLEGSLAATHACLMHCSQPCWLACSFAVQINEFGQCPRQLFKHKHPQRLVCPPAQMPPCQQPGQAASTGADSGSGALPLVLVSTILAAAARGHGESPRLEVSPLLAKLDVLAARRQQAPPIPDC